MTWSNDELNIINTLNNNVYIFKEENLIYNGKNYSSYDAYNNNYTCEIKKRNFESYHNYAKEGLILERKKYQKLLEKAKQNNTQSLYINLFTDNVIFIWNLSKLTLENYNFNWHNKKMNKETFNSKYNKIEKEVCLLKKDITFLTETIVEGKF
jgi:hypothetical protein